MPAGSKTPASRPADPTSVKGDFSVEEQKDLLRISLSGKPIVDFVFRDDKIRRPYFANARLANGWLLVWSAEFLADQREIVFGNQEEMGFGARVATPFTENNGGTLRSSTGKKTAKDTWGQPALVRLLEDEWRPLWRHHADGEPRKLPRIVVAQPRLRRVCRQPLRTRSHEAGSPQFDTGCQRRDATNCLRRTGTRSSRIRFGSRIHDIRKVLGN